jgi:hypothetical protein
VCAERQEISRRLRLPEMNSVIPKEVFDVWIERRFGPENKFNKKLLRDYEHFVVSFIVKQAEEKEKRDASQGSRSY